MPESPGPAGVLRPAHEVVSRDAAQVAAVLRALDSYDALKCCPGCQGKFIAIFMPICGHPLCSACKDSITCTGLGGFVACPTCFLSLRPLDWLSIHTSPHSSVGVDDDDVRAGSPVSGVPLAAAPLPSVVSLHSCGLPDTASASPPTDLIAAEPAQICALQSGAATVSEGDAGGPLPSQLPPLPLARTSSTLEAELCTPLPLLPPPPPVATLGYLPRTLLGLGEIEASRTYSVDTELAAQRFMEGVLQRVPMARVAQMASHEPMAAASRSPPRTTCIAAASDIVWVDSLLSEMGAIALPLATSDLPLHPVERGRWLIDVIIDDSDTTQSWESTLRQYRARDGVDTIALLVELLTFTFPTVTAGQTWVTDEPTSSARRLMTFVSFPDGARAARDFARVLFRDLSVDPLAIEEVRVEYQQLAFPTPNGKMSITHNASRATTRPVLPYEGAFVGPSGIEELLVGAARQPHRITAQCCAHVREASVGAVVSSLQGNVADAYALTAGHLCAGADVRSAKCDTAGYFNMPLQYVGHSDYTHFIVGGSPSVASPIVGHRSAAVADVALFSFRRENSVGSVPTTQPSCQLQPFVTFPSRESWNQIALRGHGREIDDSPEGEVGEREYTANGWVSAPSRRDPSVRHCLYLAGQPGEVHRRLQYMEGHSSASVCAGPRDAPTLHSFVCQTVILRCRCTERVFRLQGLTPAVLALEQARLLLQTAGVANVGQLHFVVPAPSAPPPVAAQPSRSRCIVS